MKYVALLTTFLILLLSSCISASKNNLLLVHLVDVSSSAQQDEDFSRASKRACHSVAEAAQNGDKYLLLLVDASNPRYEDPLEIKGQDTIHQQCHNLKNHESPADQGTFPCYSWEIVDTILERSEESELVPTVISQIQTNELEEGCDDVVIELAEEIEARNGIFIHANSENTGAKYNAWLRDTLLSNSTEDNQPLISERHLLIRNADVGVSVSQYMADLRTRTLDSLRSPGELTAEE